MNGLLDTKPAIDDTDAETDEETVHDVRRDDDETLEELKCRCRELLARKCRGDCEPGHWLG
jgi:hypothetical protein